MSTTYTVTNNFAADTPAVGSQVNTNFLEVLAALNDLDASNLKSTTTVPVACISSLTSTQMSSAFFKDEDDMASDSATAVASQQSVKAYVDALMIVPAKVINVFSAWASKSDNTVYLAATDGEVHAICNTWNAPLVGYTDSSNPPTTVRQRMAGASAAAHDAAWTSIKFSVRKGDYWKTYGATTVYWLPIGV